MKNSAVESELHLEKANRKLEASRKLLELSEYDDSISRSYYAIYHAAKAALATKGSFPKSHEGTKTEFGRLLLKPGDLPTELGETFTKAKAYREKSDYLASFRGDRKVAVHLLEGARGFVGQVEEYLSTHRRGSVKRRIHGSS